MEEDISLTLTTTQPSPLLQVETNNGTAFLVLARSLDREGVAGPASLSTSILCQRLGENSQDPGFLIPLTVRYRDIKILCSDWLRSWGYASSLMP